MSPATPVTASRPAPLEVDPLEPVAERADELADAVLEGFELDVVMPDVEAALEAPVEDGATEAALIGALDAAAISACTVVLNVPLMPVKVNQWENDSAGIAGLLGSIVPRDTTFTK